MNTLLLVELIQRVSNTLLLVKLILRVSNTLLLVELIQKSCRSLYNVPQRNEQWLWEDKGRLLEAPEKCGPQSATTAATTTTTTTPSHSNIHHNKFNWKHLEQPQPQDLPQENQSWRTKTTTTIQSVNG